MATFDAFALATAIGQRAPRLRLTIGPLAIGVRTPVAVALGLSSVRDPDGQRGGRRLGASSPAIVHGWHDRPWEALPTQMHETVTVLRALLAGERGDFDGARVRTHGFRLQRPVPQATITVAAFGRAMTRVAARVADTVVLNLVTPAHVSRCVRSSTPKRRGSAGARRASRCGCPRPRSRHRDPPPARRADRPVPPSTRLWRDVRGHGLRDARAGGAERPAPSRARGRDSRTLLDCVGAIGSRIEITARIAAHHAAGADDVALVPATAEDAGGRSGLAAVRSL